MIHPQLRLVATKFALDLADITDLVDASHAALDDAIYADGLAVIATTPNMPFWEAVPHFIAALRELRHAFASQDDALRCLRLGYFGPVAEGAGEPDYELGEHYGNLHRMVQFGPLAKLGAWEHPSAWGLVSHWYSLDDIREPWQTESEADLYTAWQAKAIELCREWCREYTRFYLQPAWRSPTVVALAAGIHADRAFDRLPILADALEEAGCDHPDLLAHCRTPGPHTDYCWLVDAVLNGGA